jgi:TonB family protein
MRRRPIEIVLVMRSRRLKSNLALRLSPRVGVLLLLYFACASIAAARPSLLAVLDLGETQTAEHAAEQLAQAFSKQADFALVNRAQARAAARGIGYSGSLNLSLEEARDLGAAVGCDFLLTGEAQTLRRSAFDRADYFESYASLFLVSARTGRLLLWEQPSAEAATPMQAEQLMLAELNQRIDVYADLLRAKRAAERDERLAAIARDMPVIADVPTADTPDAAHLRAPRPFRRLQPKYPDTAAHMEVEATVDVLVEIDARGEVGNVEVVRWAGYGLDESVIATVRQLHFFPAQRDGVPSAMRVLLRYNFRKPPKEKQRATS